MKLLFSEYCDFEDMVLIESPFAQTTREGRGIRQVHLGLTPSKLILATDVLPPVDKSCIYFLAGIDPVIETFELIAIYPIECVNLSVFRRHKRQAIKAHFCNNRVFFFELGGFENRNMFWNLWCEKLKFLSPDSGSSHSETSVATSSTNSTLYLVDSRQVVKPNGLKQLWCKFGTGKVTTGLARKWTDRCLFLGKSYEDAYKPIMNPPQISDFLKPKQLSNFCVVSSRTLSSNPNEIHIGDSLQINRFSSGVKEGCSTGLFLTAEDYILPMRFSDTTQSSGCLVEAPNDFVDYVRLAEESVRLWESQKQTKTHESRHRRRYAFAPQPLFLHGLGPWNVPPGAKFSIQVKRAVSVVNIRRQPIEPELRLPVTKRQLVATISCEALHLASKDTMKINSQPGCGPRKPVIFFWTPDYWYRPRSAKDAYVELQNHLQKIRVYHQKRRKCRRFFRRRHIPPPSSDSSDSEGVRKRRKAKKRKSVIRFNMFGGKTQEICNEPRKDSNESSLQFLKRLLRIDVVLTAWDFNSTVLAQQLTMIDRDLFLKISSVELNVLIWQQSSKNAPNIQAAIAFSHRISCLVASDILKNECERARSRLIARFINVAYKCHRISNFQSCRTIVFGLQSPAIYRLKSTWAYVRKKHATKYETFEFLCRLYRDPRLLIYQKAFFLTTQNTPYLPFIGDVIAKLLGRIPYYPLKSPVRGRSLQLLQNKTIGHQNCLLTRLLVSLKLLNLGEDVEKGRKGLCDYFEPLDCHEDNRVKCLIETTEFLQQSQLSALHYSFMVNSVAKDYLLKARYREERDNFYESFRVEMVDSSQELCLG